MKYYIVSAFIIVQKALFGTQLKRPCVSGQWLMDGLGKHAWYTADGLRTTLNIHLEIGETFMKDESWARWLQGTLILPEGERN